MRLLSLESVLVATDLGDLSRPALRTAARLATFAGASLHLLHVESHPSPDGETRLLHEFRLAVADAAEPDSVRVLAGSPAVVIVEHAIKLDAHVVVLGPHRGVGAPSQALGSTATSVVRTAPCPCLVAVTELHLPLEKVVAPIDLSDVASGALAVALSWASALRPRGASAHLTVLHVAREPSSTQGGARVREEVQQARKRAGGAARVEIHERVVSGIDPEEGILRATVAESADLLVMGTRGAAGAQSGLGSVSAAVARITPAPLLLVPPVIWEEHRPARA